MEVTWIVPPPLATIIPIHLARPLSGIFVCGRERNDLFCPLCMLGSYVCATKVDTRNMGFLLSESREPSTGWRSYLSLSNSAELSFTRKKR